jgi:multidrug efflux pump subunit AcrA (membrane-fusion protein)
MYANTYVQLAHKENVLTVPLLAVQRDDSSKTTALVMDSQNQVHQPIVELGTQGSLLAEVKSGLEQDDRVVLGNAARYRDGEQITPRMEQQPANDARSRMFPAHPCRSPSEAGIARFRSTSTRSSLRPTT